MKDYHNLPTMLGVYLFKDSDGKIIYIGKAKNLKSRVSSYFKLSDLTPKTKILVSHINDIDFIIVDTEVEALLLENKLIKQHSPKYNISLKDSKTYAYILVTDEEYPRIVAVRSTARKGKYFGPYTDGSARHQVMQLAIKLFKLRICRTIPKRACLNYHIGLCTAPCIDKVTKEHYLNQVKSAMEFLGGNTEPTIKILMKEMQQASEENRFEVALEKKNQLEAISILNEKQKVDLVKKFDQDIIAMHSENNFTTIILFSIKRGVIQGKTEFRFEMENHLLASFLTQYYSTHQIPEEIILSEMCTEEDSEQIALEQYLSIIKGSKVIITVPQRGEKAALAEMALRNAKFGSSEKILEEMQEKLRLKTIPRIIECFDISNLSYDYIVAGMTQWIDGSPNKEGYRRFEIKTVAGKNDDFASVREVILRRYSRLKKENRSLPDLIIIDGGKGQLNIAVNALQEIGVIIPVISLAKREEEIYVPYQSSSLKFEINSPMMLFLRRIRDSTHDFAISYNRKKRQMRIQTEMTQEEKEEKKDKNNCR